MPIMTPPKRAAPSRLRTPPAQIAAAAEGTPVSVKINGRAAGMKLDITPRQRDILLAGGLLNYTREHKED